MTRRARSSALARGASRRDPREVHSRAAAAGDLVGIGPEHLRDLVVGDPVAQRQVEQRAAAGVEIHGVQRVGGGNRHDARYRQQNLNLVSELARARSGPSAGFARFLLAAKAPPTSPPNWAVA